MKVNPSDVLWMDRNKKLPLYIRNAWRVFRAEDPVEAARKCIAHDRKRRIFGGLSLFAAMGLFSVFMFSAYADMLTTTPDKYLSRERSPWIFASVFGAVFTMALGVGALNSARFIKEYSGHEGQFGHEYGKLLDLAHARFESFGSMTQEDAMERVTKSLTIAALEVLRAEKVVEEHRQHRYEEGWNPVYHDEYRRSQFKDRFALAKIFTLTEPNGWGPYFEAAKAALTNSELSA